MLATAGLFIGVMMMMLSGAAQAAFVPVLGGLFCLVLLTGVLGAAAVYRTLPCLPHFTSWARLLYPTSHGSR